VKRRLLLGAVFLIGAAALILRSLLGLHNVAPGAEPLDGDPDAVFDAVLQAHVFVDGVDYEGLAQNEGLRRYAATLSTWGPRTAVTAFPDDDARLAYYINAYNALTLLGVVDHWPIDSIQDVRGRIEPKPGFGFFFAQRFRLDGKTVDLYRLENDTIRGFGDARIHAAINCASASCPTLESRAFRADDLQARLDAATRNFVSTPPHVAVVDGELRLSSIFQWFAGDFEQHAARLGKPADVRSFIAAFATPEVAAAVQAARNADLPIVYVDYDWSLNRRGNVAAAPKESE